VGDHQRLKQLILGEELAEFDAHGQRVAALEAARRGLPDELPDLLRQSQRGQGRQRLSRVLAAPVAEALGTAVREQRQTIVDALFPVIGPAIRRAIAEALRDFTESFNRVLESSFTPRGLRWRLESWRTGIPYVQVVLRHNLRFRLDHLFLIERDSGLVLARQSAADLPDLDADAIAGMLTAIGDFVRDSVGTAGTDGTLDSAGVGEHLVWVEPGPRANLAAFLRGVPPTGLRLLLRQRLERIHAWLEDPQREVVPGAAPDTDPVVQQSLDLQSIEKDFAAAAAAQRGRPARRWPLLLMLLVAVLALGAWQWREWQWQRQLAAAAQLLADWPGLHVDAVSGTRGKLLQVRGLIDPAAEDPRPRLRALLPPEVELDLQWRGYLATDAPIVLARAQRQLVPPPGVQLSLAQGRLLLQGEAPAAWIAQARERGAWIAGVESVDADGLRATDAAAPQAAAAPVADDWPQRVQALQALRVLFTRETDMADPDGLAALLAAAQELRALAMRRGQPLRLVCHGHNDEPGTATTNRGLRERRARWLCEKLAAAGFAAADLRAAGGEPAPNQPTIAVRAASLRLELEPASPEPP
jgi:outer membrane protein OmpA-like peptidoglycan-associated protein